jgi:SAM-dependent methyltransferase
LPNSNTISQYGTLEWFEQAYANVSIDPWGLTWRPSQQFRYHRVLSILDAVQKPLSRVLDVGCATGEFTSILSRYVPGVQTLWGVDFVESAVERARCRFPQLTFSNESLLTIGDRYPQQFDLVTCLEVLYYVPGDLQREALRSIKRALCPSGYAVFSSFLSHPPYFSPQQFLDIVGSEFEIVKSEVLHLRLISLLEKVGDRLEKRFPSPLRGVKVGRLPFRVVVALERWSRYLKSRTASHMVLLARA